ncbi:MAG: xylose isomerase, partial [Algoriphagus sp. 32-45-6]
EFNVGDYPYPEMFRLFAQMNYQGWILMEARTQPADRVAALKEQLELFEGLVAGSRL